MSRNKKGIINFIDWQIVIIYLFMVLIGWLLIYSSEFALFESIELSSKSRYGKQLYWIGISIVVAFIIQLFDNKFFTVFSPLIYFIIILSLIAVLFFGKEISGARSWFEIGGIGKFQPSEFAKVGTALLLAKLLNHQDVSINKLSNLIATLIVIAIPMALIIFQGDTGTAIVFSCFILVFYREGLSGIMLLISLILTVIGLLALFFNYMPLAIILFVGSTVFFIQKMQKLSQLEIMLFVIISISILTFPYLFSPLFSIILMTIALLIFAAFSTKYNQYVLKFGVLVIFLSAYIQLIDYGYENLLRPHQQKRIDVLLGKVDDIRGAAYNIHQSKIAIGAGGFIGKGYLNGTQTKGDFVPEKTTDFIFCILGEEFGFVGGIVILILYLVLLMKVIIIAERQRSRFNRIYAYCVASILFFHIFINIGMTIGISPIIGIPLPYLSYGGSSLLSFTILLFILIRIDAERMFLIH